ncbi:MAG: hypothetical protein P8N19_08450 [Flavobacteriales bacterium]|nr:hypothetical protein [Flavobacteriales bacterium]
MEEQQKDTSLASTNIIVFLYQWRKVIIGLCFLAAVASSIASFIIEEKFKSSVTMFATPQHSIGEQFYEEQKKEDLLEFGEKEDAERLLQILNSDRIRNRVIEKYNLWEHYDISISAPGANTIMGKEYNSNVSSKLTRYGSILVEVLDKSDTLAALMANDIAFLLDSVSNELRNGRAMEAFMYAKNSLEQVQGEIRLLEDSMGTIRSYGVYDYFTQIETLSEQYGTAIVNGQPKRAEQIRQQMEEISQYGNIYNKLDALLEAAYEREEVLKKRYDLMYLDATSQLPSKFVVDYAAVSDKKAYPVRWLIVVMSVAATFLISVIGILIVENFRSLKAQGKI